MSLKLFIKLYLLIPDVLNCTRRLYDYIQIGTTGFFNYLGGSQKWFIILWLFWNIPTLILLQYTLII